MPSIAVTEDYKPPCRCWAPILGPLQNQYVLLTHEIFTIPFFSLSLKGPDWVGRHSPSLSSSLTCDAKVTVYFMNLKFSIYRIGLGSQLVSCIPVLFCSVVLHATPSPYRFSLVLFQGSRDARKNYTFSQPPLFSMLHLLL